MMQYSRRSRRREALSKIRPLLVESCRSRYHPRVPNLSCIACARTSHRTPSEMELPTRLLLRSSTKSSNHGLRTSHLRRTGGNSRTRSGEIYSVHTLTYVPRPTSKSCPDLWWSVSEQPVPSLQQRITAISSGWYSEASTGSSKSSATPGHSAGSCPAYPRTTWWSLPSCPTPATCNGRGKSSSDRRRKSASRSSSRPAP